MATDDVWVFFYGSFMNRAVLREGGFVLGDFEAARLRGYDVATTPLVTLVPAPDTLVYGIACQGSSEALGRLYGTDWPYRASGPSQYVPRAVLVESVTTPGRQWPAMCYIAPVVARVVPQRAYLERVTLPAREYGFPTWYLERLARLAEPDAIIGV